MRIEPGSVSAAIMRMGPPQRGQTVTSRKNTLASSCAALLPIYRKEDTPTRHPSRGLIFHSDRGVQYACKSFRKELKSHGFRSSMSRKGDPWDNAVAESFFRILKSELVDHTMWHGYADAYRHLFQYIEVYYNTMRLHSTLGRQTPAQFELQTVKEAA